MRVTFKFSPEKDVENIHRICHAPLAYGAPFKLPEALHKIALNKPLEECSKELLEERSPIYKSPFMSFHFNSIKESWESIEERFFRKLDTITGLESPTEITAFLSTVNRCPYNPEENSLMFSFFKSIPHTLCDMGHEIMHLHFHKHHFKLFEKELGYQKAHEVKEALTVLLNLEFKDLWFVYDQGYENHKALREFITAEWEKTKNYDKLLKTILEHLKAERRVE